MLISNSINNSNGKLTQFGFLQGNNNNNNVNGSSADSENNQATSESDRKNSNNDDPDSVGSDIFEDTSSVSDFATVSEIDVKLKVEDSQVSSSDDSENESKEISTVIKLGKNLNNLCFIVIYKILINLR